MKQIPVLSVPGTGDVQLLPAEVPAERCNHVAPIVQRSTLPQTFGNPRQAFQDRLRTRRQCGNGRLRIGSELVFRVIFDRQTTRDAVQHPQHQFASRMQFQPPQCGTNRPCSAPLRQFGPARLEVIGTQHLSQT